MSVDDNTKDEGYETLRREFSKALQTIDRLSKQLEMHPAQAFMRAVQIAEPIFVALHDALLDCADDNGVLVDESPFVPRTIIEAYKVGLVSQARDALTCAIKNERLDPANVDTDALRDKYTGGDTEGAFHLDGDVVKLCDEVDRLRAQIERAEKRVGKASAEKKARAT